MSQSKTHERNGSIRGVIAALCVCLLAGSTAFGQVLPGPCAIDMESPACPDSATACGADFAGGSGCIVAGLGNCYQSGIRGYGVPAGMTLNIDLNADLLKLDVFFANETGGSGTMTFFDATDVQVDAPIMTNGDCANGPMPPPQIVTFSSAVRRIEVTATGARVWIDDFTVNPDVCGNGTLDAGEDCDDGNLDNGDGCDATCAVEVVDPVPTASEWGLGVMTLLLLSAGTVVLRRRTPSVA